MGQKINPNGFRVGVIRDWTAKWYAEKDFANYLNEDLRIRKYIEKRLADASVSTVEIERAANRVNVSIHTAKPGMVIGKGGSEVEALRKELNEKVQDASIVIVAQRVSTILHADQILVLDDGKIVGKGTHEELLKNCEVYLQIAKSQLSEKELGLEKLGLAEEKAEKETNKKEILSTKIDEKENNKLKEKSDDKKLKHKKGGK